MRPLFKLSLLLLLVGGGILLAPSLLAQDRSSDGDPCLEIAPERATHTFFVGLGDVYFEQNDYTDAIVAYTCAIERNETYAPAYINRGFAYAIQLNFPPALEDYNRALELDGNAITAYNNRGLLYFNQGTFGLALTDFTLAVTLNPNFAIAYHNRGLVHAAEGNYELAITDLQQAIALDADYAAPHASLGAVYTAQALESYQQYREVAGEGAVLPGISAENILSRIEEGAQLGTFSTWLDFATPARAGG